MNRASILIFLAVFSFLCFLVSGCGPDTHSEKGRDEEAYLEFTVPTGSMEDTLHVGEKILVDTRIEKINRGDIVVFKFPGDPEIYKMDEDDLLVQRIIGMPLEEVRIFNHRVFIDGVPVEELGLDEESYTLHWRNTDRERAEAINAPCFDYDPGSELQARIEFVFRIPEGCYFVMADHRDVAVDSRGLQYRHPWAVPRENIVGVYRPPTEKKSAEGEEEGVVSLPKEITNSIGMKLRLIPAGSFLMGASPGDSDAYSHEEMPQHNVQITKAFYIGVYEVTQEQYEAVMRTNPSHFRGSRRPVEQVSWKDAVRFCQQLSLEEGVTYRLPTEAEWEYACRAGTTTRYYWGDSSSDLHSYANFADRSFGKNYNDLDRADDSQDDGYADTSPVGSFRPNAWDLFDMSGNVREWCEDWYDAVYYYSSPQQNPRGPATGEYRVFRGGSWDFNARHLRSSCRHRSRPGNRSECNGFRVIRDVE